MEKTQQKLSVIDGTVEPTKVSPIKRNPELMPVYEETVSSAATLDGLEETKRLRLVGFRSEGKI